MKLRFVFAVLLPIALIACQKEAPPQKEIASSSTTEKQPVAAVVPPKPITPERIKEIEASGRTGLWASTTEVCASEAGLRTTLTWNVKDLGAERVVAYVVANNGKEQHFGQGGPIGEKETGPWLRPGVIFKIRDYNSQEELGSVTIVEKPC